MKKSTRFLTAILTVILVVSVLCVTASAAKMQFTDVDAKNEELTNAVSLLSYLNVTNGTTDTTFGTDENVTRQQMAAFIYRLVKNGKSFESTSANTTQFKDLTDSTYYGYISWASANGIINGTSETTFNPTGNITLQDAYTMLVRALGYDETSEISYPYGYIEKAESDAIELDKNLPASVEYTTALTRGNVAILLYNTFFAKTSIVEEQQVTRVIRLENSGVNKVVVETVEYSPTVAEHYYNAERGQFTVRATPHYSFNDSQGSEIYAPLDSGYNQDMVRLVAVENDEKVTDFLYNFDELDLEGTADDYIMNVFDIFYTVKAGDEKAIDTILYVDSECSVETATKANLVKRNATADEDYYRNPNGTKSGYAKLSGQITFNKTRVYFYDAPYTYAKPKFSGTATEAEKYDLKNAKNVQMIDIELIGYDNNDQPKYNYYVLSDQPDTPEKLAVQLNQVYTAGFYTIVAYDVDGDGLVNYMQYKPCTFGRISTDDSVDFTDVDEHYDGKPKYIDNDDTHPKALAQVPTIYSNGAVMSGAECKDGDFVIAYLNPQANMIDVFAVVGYTEGTLSYIKDSTATIKISGKTYRTHCTYLSVLGFDVGSVVDDDTNYLRASTNGVMTYFKDTLLNVDSLGESFRVYTYKGTYDSVYFYEPISTASNSYSGNDVLIPIGEKNADVTQDGYGYAISKFNSQTGDIDHFLKVWENGTTKYVPVNVDDIYPQPNYYDSNVNFGVYDEVDGLSYPAYIGKLCTYSVDANGIYTITPILHSYDEDGTYTGINRDATVLVEDNSSEQFGRDLGHTESGVAEQAQIRKIVGNRYELVDTWGYSLLGNDAQYINNFVMTDATKIIIRNYNTSSEKYEFVTYDKSTFMGTTSPDTMLTNVQYVLKGDPDSKVQAELLLLYAEAEDFEFVAKKATSDWRIIKSYAPGKDDEGNLRYFYDLVNPFDGTVQEGVPGSKASKSGIHDFVFEGVGEIVKVDALGKVRESLDETYGLIDPFINEDYSVNIGEDFRMVWILGYDEESGIIEVVDVEDTLDALTADEVADQKAAFDEIVDEISLDPIFFEVDANTAITLIKSEEDDADAFIKKGTVSALELSDLANAKNEIKAYNSKIENNKGDFTTKYAKYVKAYVKTTPAVDEDENDFADFIVVVANATEQPAFLTK